MLAFPEEGRNYNVYKSIIVYSRHLKRKLDLGGSRWIRDETKPGVNEYYVKTVVWRPNKKTEELRKARDLTVPNSFPVKRSARPSVPVGRQNGRGEGG